MSTERTTIEIEGETVEAATKAAMRELGVERAGVEVEVLSEPSRGLFGIGSRKARVRVTLSSPTVEPLEPVAEMRDAEVPEAHRELETDDEPSGIDEPLDDATVARAAELLQEIVRLVGVEVTIDSANDGDHATLTINGDTSGLLIGRKGQMLDALEYVITRILGKELGRVVHVTVDSEGYRARRQETLEELARRMGEEARRKRRPIRLNDLTPRERRIVHLVLRQEAGVTTRSSGEGHLRTLIILPSSARPPRAGSA